MRLREIDVQAECLEENCKHTIWLRCYVQSVEGQSTRCGCGVVYTVHVIFSPVFPNMFQVVLTKRKTV